MPRIGLLLTLVAALAASALAAPKRHRAASVPALKGRLEGVRGKKQALRAQIHATRAHAQEVKHTIVVVDGQLEGVKARLAATQRDLGAARRDQLAAKAKVAQANADLAAARARARARLRALGKQGEANVLVAFVSADSMGDLADRQDTMARIARRDHEIFARVKALQRQVTERKRQQDAAVARVAALEGREHAQQADLRDVRAQKGEQLQGLRHKEADQEESLQQFEDDEREIRRLIALANVPRHRPGHAPIPRFLGRFMRPVDAPVTSRFGMRYHPILHIARLHAGIDFGTPVGTPVRSAAPGEVVAATCMRGFGNVVIVDHGGGVSTVYGHLSRLGVHAGERLSQGQILGASGNSGLSTGPHLHWEVHVGGRAVDPMGRF